MQKELISNRKKAQEKLQESIKILNQDVQILENTESKSKALIKEKLNESIKLLNM